MRRLDALKLRGLEITTTGSVRPVSAVSYKVTLATGKAYRVTWRKQKWYCSCHNRNDNTPSCEHVYAVLLCKSSNPTVREPSEIVCPDCGAGRRQLIKRGSRKNRYGLTQRYSCRKCGLRFDERLGFRKMKASPEAITATLDLYFKGLSLNKIVDHLDQFYGIKTRASTLYGWVKKYTIAMRRHTRGLKLRVAKKWHADETTLTVKGRAYYMWTTLDHNSRFAIATHLSLRRRSEYADKLLQESKRRVLRHPDKIVTDGLSSYVAPIGCIDNGNTGAPQHVRGLSFRKDGNNNRIERFNGTVKERVKVMRGLHNPQAAAVFVDGFADYYNFIRPNLALGGRTPAEKAGVVRLQGNRWMALIRRSSRRRRMRHQEGRKTT